MRVSNQNNPLRSLRDELKEELTLIQTTNEDHLMQSETNRKHLREQLKNDVRRVEESLSKKLQRLQKLYTNDKSSSIERGYNGFLFQQKLEDMFKEEEKFTLSLTKYTREQFSGGITDLASCADKSKYKLLDTSKPDTFLFEGSLPGRNWEREELERLQSAYFTSQRNRISSELSNVKTKKILAQAEKQVRMLKTMKNFDVTTEQVAEQVEKNVKEVEAHQSSINTALTNVGDRLIKLQELNSTQVIQGNYNLKLMRQDYFISKQDEVIKQLLVQFSHNYFLAMLYEVEYKAQKDVHRIFNKLQSMIDEEVHAVEKRINKLSDTISQITSEKQVISSSDTYMNTVYEAFESEHEEGKEKIYRSYSQMLASANTLSTNTKEAEGRCTRASDESKSKLHLIETTLNNLHTLMNSPVNGSYEKFTHSLTNNEDNLALSEGQINGAIKDLVEKKNRIKVDTVEDLKRNIMADFFNDPTRLKRNLEDLKIRAKLI